MEFEKINITYCLENNWCFINWDKKNPLNVRMRIDITMLIIEASFNGFEFLKQNPAMTITASKNKNDLFPKIIIYYTSFTM